MIIIYEKEFLHSVFVFPFLLRIDFKWFSKIWLRGSTLGPAPVDSCPGSLLPCAWSGFHFARLMSSSCSLGASSASAPPAGGGAPRTVGGSRRPDGTLRKVVAVRPGFRSEELDGPVQRYKPRGALVRRHAGQERSESTGADED